MIRLIFAIALALTPLSARAVTLLPTCTANGNCTLTDILAVVVNFAEILLGLSGAVALLFFVWGGIQMIIAFGDQAKIKDGLSTIKNAAYGIAIILLAGVIVRFTTSALTGRIDNVCDTKDAKAGACMAMAGNSCDQNGIWVLLPGGTRGGLAVPAQLTCIQKGSCDGLNGAMQELGRAENYTCKPTNAEGDNVSSRNCVRGLCTGPTVDYACCL